MAEQQELKTYNLLSLPNFDYITDKRWDDMWYIVSVLYIYCRYMTGVYMYMQVALVKCKLTDINFEP